MSRRLVDAVNRGLAELVYWLAAIASLLALMLVVYVGTQTLGCGKVPDSTCLPAPAFLQKPSMQNQGPPCEGDATPRPMTTTSSHP